MESIIVNPQLKAQISEVSSKSINWETFLKASMISAEELERIQKVDKLSSLKLAEFQLQEFLDYFNVVLLFLQKIVRVDTVQYLLLMLDQATMIVSDSYLQQIPQNSLQDAYTVLARCLSKEDELSKVMAAKVLGHLTLCAGGLSNAAFTTTMTWILAQLSTYKPTVGLDISLQVISCFLRTSKLRTSVYQYPGAVSALVDYLIKGSCTPQINYEIIFAFWLLTFVPVAVVEMQKKYDIIPILMETSRNAVKEKVVRICILTLRNLLEKAPEANIMPMVGNKLFTMCETLLSRKWSDEDIVEDLTFIKDELQKHIQKLTNFEEYSSEVRSGRLEWSPVHTSETFWKHNAQKLNEKDHELLRILAKILSTSTSPLVLAVACHDIMQYIKHYSYGKRFVQDLGAKQQIMELMTHKDSEVRYNALMAIQQYMSNAWEFQ